MRKIDFMLTAFRDGLQSAYGARVLSEDYLPAIEAAARAGVRRFESGGGALFQSAYFYAGEDAFSVMDAFRRAAGPDARLQTLSRGVNLVALEGQASETIALHATLVRRHGADAVRNFDALNDPVNLLATGRAIKAAGLEHELALAMMDISSSREGLHTPDYYLAVLRGMLEADVPWDSVCFKDPTGSARPGTVFETVKGARRLLGGKARIVFHGHETAGMGLSANIAAIEGGADQVDLSIAPCSGGACQTDVVTLWNALRGTEYSLDVDIDRIIGVEELFRHAMREYEPVPEASRVEPLAPFLPMPGGAIAANWRMLRDAGLQDRYPDIVRAMGEVVEKAGFGASVTPLSQFYFQQAFNNVTLGPWTRIAEGYGRLVLGYFGKTPARPDPEIVRLAERSLDLKAATESPLALNDRNPQKGLAAADRLLASAGLPATEENRLIAAICRDRGILFLRGKAEVSVCKRRAATAEAGAAPSRPSLPSSGRGAAEAGDFTVTINSRAYGVRLEGNKAVVNGVSYAFDVAAGIDQGAIGRATVLPKDGEAPAVTELAEERSPLSGTVLSLRKKAGDKLAVGETVLVIETMGLETPVNSTRSGIVRELRAHVGDGIEAGDVLYLVSLIAHGSNQTVSQAAEATSQADPRGRHRVVVESPLAGVVLRIYKEPGERIRAGETLLVAESMKMETPINCAVEGVVEELFVSQGELVRHGTPLAAVRK